MKSQEKGIQTGTTGGSLPQMPSAIISSSNLISYNNTLLGEVLTLVDASLPKSEQKDALKSLIKQAGWRNCEIVLSWMNEQDDKNGSTFPFYNLKSVI